MKITRISKCRICGGTEFAKIINLGEQKLTGVFPEKGQDIESGELSLIKCISKDGCGLVQLRDSFESEKMYGDNYGYRSGLNNSMVRHLSKITRDALEKVEVADGDFILDIGSNDGTLLSTYAKWSVKELDLVGIDPTGGKFGKYYRADIKLIPDFFSAKRIIEEKGDKKARIVTSIAMFYDLEDPIDFARQVAEILADDGIWIAEQSYFPLMVKTNSYDTICHEHIEYYSLKQMTWIAEKSGLKVVDVYTNDANGGSFRIFFAKKESKYQQTENVEKMIRDEIEVEVDSVEYTDKFVSNVLRHKEALLDFLVKQKEEGKLVLGYGASTKGNVVLQYCGINEDILPAICEVNEDKFGKYTPGTNIPIISEEEGRKRKPDYMLVLPWHFKDGILDKEEEFRKDSGCKFVFYLPEFQIV